MIIISAAPPDHHGRLAPVPYPCLDLGDANHIPRLLAGFTQQRNHISRFSDGIREPVRFIQRLNGVQMKQFYIETVGFLNVETVSVSSKTDGGGTYNDGT